jgi:hypothetical protein
MKKIILLATILLVAGSVSAQTYFNGDRADFNPYYQSKWSFEAAANLSNITTGANFNTRNLAGFSVGFNLDLPVAYPLSIMPALLYAQKGFTAATPSGEYSQRLQAVELPVLAKFDTGSIFSLYLGPQISYLVSASNKYNGDFPAALRERYEYGGINLRYQGVLGLGIDVTKSFNIHTRYSFDLSGTAANGNAYVPTYHSHAFQLGFGVHL